MPTKLVTLAAVGALTLGGGALAGSALAATNGSNPPRAAAPSYAAPAPRPDNADRVERIKQALAGLVADKTLTQAQADKVASTLAASGVGPAGGPLVGPRIIGPGQALAAAAKALGMSKSDLLTQLRAGKSLAAVAKAKGVDVQKVVDALVAEAKQRLADAVKNGRLTQAQADQRLENLTARITAEVNATGPGRPFGPGGPGRFGRFGPGGAGDPGGPGARGPQNGTPAPTA